MLALGFFHGLIIVTALFAYSRWLDTSITADVCLYALILELLIAIIFAAYYNITDAILILDCGVINTGFTVFTIHLLFCFDFLTAFFLGVLTVALLICFYFLVEYFEYDASSSAIINLSALFSQLALCYFSAFDLFTLIFFWEAISIISFLLVQHWSHRVTTYKAGLKVFTISQFGDFFFLMFIFLLFNKYNTTSLLEILPLFALSAFEFIVVSSVLIHYVSILGLLLSSAVLLKSAQFFFYPWLLDAMEAPVPISAQLHSSTLVVIGFYLYYRFYPLFVLTPSLNFVYLWGGIFTAVGASVLGFFQIDGKRLLACSTASQLGYVIVALGLDLYEESLFLLSFCCCNKAFTFVWFGVLMNKNAGISDFRFIGGSNYLSWAEHAGLAVALANFTIFPGVFAWHVKGLFILGLTPVTPIGSWFGLELLQLTWFFSSLYLITLYISLFLKPSQGFFKTNTAAPLLTFKNNFLVIKFTVSGFFSLSFFLVSFFCFAFLILPSAFAFITYIDTSWVTLNTFTHLSYY